MNSALQVYFRVFSFICLASFAQGQAAPAASSSAPARLPAVVVTATGIEDEAFDIPFTVDTIDATDLQERMLSRTVPEALKELSAVMVQKTAHGQGSPFIRGFTGFRTLMLVDGIRLNNSAFREGPNQYWNTLDSFTISQLELVKGPASILYGSDAIGGTVNLRTATNQLSPTSSLDGRAYYRYASAEHSHIGRVELTGNVGDKLGLSVGHSHKEFGDLRAGKGTGLQPKTGYDEQASNVKLEYFPAAHSRVVAAYQRLEQDDAWRTHRTVFGKRWHGATIGNDNKLALDQFRDLAYVQFHQTQIGGAVDAVHLTASFQRQEEFEDRVRNTNQVNQQGFDVQTLGLSAQLESQSAIGRWIYGAEYYRDDVESYRLNYRANGTLESVSIQGPVGDDAGYDLLGVYAQDSLSVGERGEIIIGARYTAAKAEAGRVQDPVTGGVISMNESWHATVGSARGLWRLDAANRWHLFGGVSQGFRAPNLSDLTRLDIARSGELEVPSTGLNPEYFTSFEIGLKTQQRRLSGQAAYFYTRIDDMIDRYPADIATTAGVVEVKKANVGSGYVHGLELNGQIDLHDNWNLWGNLTWMRGEVNSYVTTAPVRLERQPVSRIMPLTVNAGLRWQSTERKFWSELSTQLANRQDRLSPGDIADTQRIPPGGTPGRSIVNLRAGWRASKALAISAALENVTDENYRIHGSGINEPGRNLVLAADVRF